MATTSSFVPHQRKEHSYLSRLLFRWARPLLNFGQAGFPSEISDLSGIPSHLDAETASCAVMKYYSLSYYKNSLYQYQLM